MAGLLPAGVGDGSADQHFANGVKERQATRGSLRAHDSDHLGYSLGLACLVAAPGVHFGGLCSTGAGRRRLNPESLQQAREFRTGAASDIRGDNSELMLWHWERGAIPLDGGRRNSRPADDAPQRE
jgi:hypothetical protein